jgi:N-acetylmuramoyl-L-alanine amidase
VDPGHGGRETGAVAASGLMEKNVNLRIALKLAALLRAGGYTAVLTRDSDRAVNTAGMDLNGNGVVDNDDDLQARVDIANAAHADILVSIHNDGSPDSSARGTKTFYCDVRPFESENIRLAQDLRSALVASIIGAGYNTRDLGAGDDAPLKKPYGHLFVLGPLTPRVARASEMPGALGETLYLTNPGEASLLASDQTLAAIAQGYYDGIAAYFSGK